MVNAIQRPLGVSVLAVLEYIGAGVCILATAFLLLGSAALSSSNGPQAALTGYLVPLAVVLAVSGAIALALGWGLWKLRPWARIATLVLQAIGLVIALGAFLMVGASASGVAQLVVQALVSGAIIYYLRRPETVAAFGSTAAAFGAATLAYAAGPTYIPTPEPAPPSPAAAPTRTEDRQAPAQAWLVVKNGPLAGQRFDLAEETAIGREADCAVRLDQDEWVGRRHALIRFENGQFFLYDTGSRNGTFVNERQVRRLMLSDGNLIRLGQTTLEFKRTGRSH